MIALLHILVDGYTNRLTCLDLCVTAELVRTIGVSGWLNANGFR
jgi:hypothetical protein